MLRRGCLDATHAVIEQNDALDATLHRPELRGEFSPQVAAELRADVMCQLTTKLGRKLLLGGAEVKMNGRELRIHGAANVLGQAADVADR